MTYKLMIAVFLDQKSLFALIVIRTWSLRFLDNTTDYFPTSDLVGNLSGLPLRGITVTSLRV
jgi:hypothetical protein